MSLSTPPPPAVSSEMEPPHPEPVPSGMEPPHPKPVPSGMEPPRPGPVLPEIEPPPHLGPGPEKPSEHQPRPNRGYAHLATFMTKTHHGMFRQFKDISTQNLLYLQAEIYQLKFELDREATEDAEFPETNERGLYDRSWRLLATSGMRTEGKRWKIFLKLRQKIYEYQDALQRHSKNASMPGPTNHQRDVLSKIIGWDSLSDASFSFISREMLGLEPEAYKKEFLDDLVLLESTDEVNDPLERFVVRSVLRLCRIFGGCKMNMIKPGDIENGLHGLGGKLMILDGRVYQYSKKTYSAANRIIGAVSSTVVPLASVVTLNSMHDSNVRVGLVCVFSIAFCLALSALTKTRRIEIFAATAAFMSVQLVFISQNNASN